MEVLGGYWESVNADLHSAFSMIGSSNPGVHGIWGPDWGLLETEFENNN
jgi:hypothetical protein